MGVVSRLRSIGSGSDVAVRANLVNLGFVAALVILVVIAIASYRSVERLREHVWLVEHTQQVRSGIYELLALCAEARIAWRNFLTDSPGSDVASFEAMGVSIDRRIQSLKALTADNPDQQHDYRNSRSRWSATSQRCATACGGNREAGASRARS